MVVVSLHAAEHAPAAEAELRQQGLESRDAREACPPGARLEVLRPEDVGSPGLREGVRDLGVSDDLGRVLERHPGVEAHEERLQKPDARLGPRQVERLEDLVGPDHARAQPADRPESLATMSFSRKRASSLNQKSRKGSWSRAWSKRATAAALERRLMAA